MSAALAGVGGTITVRIAATIAPQRARHGTMVVIRRLFARGVAPLDVNVVIPPRVLLEHGVLEASHPGLHQNVLVAIRVVHPWSIGIHELGHATKKARPFGAFGQLLSLLVELVELGQVETGKVVDTGVRAVEKRHEPEALGCRIDLAQEPPLKPARACYREEIGPIL